jgi:hypothetical protein
MSGTTTDLARVSAADVLSHRDPGFIRHRLPIIRWWAEQYFRGEIEGMEHIPAAGPVQLIGNHSGGTATPDTHVFNNAFYARFGVERPYYQLAHDLVLASPIGPGEWLTLHLHTDTLLRLKSVPVSLSLPWVVSVGDLALHLPLPARIQVQVREPIEMGRRRDGTVEAEVLASLQAGVDEPARRRRFPVLGQRCPPLVCRGFPLS